MDLLALSPEALRSLFHWAIGGRYREEFVDENNNNNFVCKDEERGEAARQLKFAQNCCCQVASKLLLLISFGHLKMHISSVTDEKKRGGVCVDGVMFRPRHPIVRTYSSKLSKDREVNKLSLNELPKERERGNFFLLL